jgi:hypothetical protein
LVPVRGGPDGRQLWVPPDLGQRCRRNHVPSRARATVPVSVYGFATTRRPTSVGRRSASRKQYGPPQFLGLPSTDNYPSPRTRSSCDRCETTSTLGGYQGNRGGPRGASKSTYFAARRKSFISVSIDSFPIPPARSEVQSGRRWPWLRSVNPP